MKQQVAITAVGVVSALGATLDGVREGLFRGDQGGIVRSAGLIPGRECFVASVREVLPTCPKGLEKMWSRNVALTLMALRQIEGRVAAAIDKYGRDRIAIVIGSSTSGISEVESVVRAHCEGRAAPAPYNYRQQQMGTVSLVLSQVLGVVGPSYTISTACSSSGKVFRAARNLLRAGLADCVITGGIDSLCGLTIQGFSSLQLVSDHVTNPFSKNRSGITIGEAAALFVLERSDVVSGERPVIVRGVGESSDAYHISSPDPSGAGALAAIRAAFADAEVAAEDVDYVNLHGTGTPHNDLMEATAVRAVFSGSVQCSSTKPLVGHTLGASGAIEAAFSWMVLTDGQQRLPPHRFDGEFDPELPALNLVTAGCAVSSAPRVVLSNSFGFGGSNCALVLSREAA
jgi:3-oxoacyl-[acyl-carrier-protein] synthase-1